VLNTGLASDIPQARNTSPMVEDDAKESVILSDDISKTIKDNRWEKRNEQ